MRSLVIVSLIFAAAYLLTLPVFSTRWSFLGLRHLFLSGTEFLLVGVILGEHGLDLLPDPVLTTLDPVTHLALGWAGLIFGVQFERKMLALYPASRYLKSFGQALVTSVATGAGVFVILPRVLPGLEGGALLEASVILGICAGPTSPSSIHYFSRIFSIRGRVNRLLKFVSAVDGIPSVLLLGLFAGLSHRFVDPTASLSGWLWLASATGLGIVLGLLLVGLVALDFRRDELLLFVLGMVILAAGLARYLHLSALYVSFIMGLTVANTAWNRVEVHKLAAYAEKPIYLTFLVLAGTRLVIDDRRVVILAAVVVVLRLAGKVVGNATWRWDPSEPLARSPTLGLALLSQGPLAIVLALEFDYHLRADPTWAGIGPLVVSTALVAVMMSEVLSPLCLRWLYPRKQEHRGGNA